MSRTSETAARLRETLGVPIYNKTLRKEVGHGELDYEVYLRTRELFALQTPASELVIPDELLFQVLHQTQELWLKCAAFETSNVVEHIDNDDLFAALAALDRVVQIMSLLRDQIRVLFTLTPERFQIIRRSLGNGSGLESPGYNQMLAAAEVAAGALARLIGRRGATLLDIYCRADAHLDVHRIAERFVDWDSAFQSWLVEHFMLVRRTIGVDKSVRALDGFPTVALGARMMKPLFTDLWNVRVEMTRAWSRDGGYAPGAERPAPPPVAPTASPPPVVQVASHSDGPDPRVSTADMVPSASPASIRGEFPLLDSCVYLNSNATGVPPRRAKAVLDEYWRSLERWRDEHWEQWWRVIHEHADDVAALIGGPPGSVVCDSNVSTLLSRVLSCFDYRARPRVVTSDLEFPSMPHILRAFERYGLAPVVVPSRDGASIDVEQVVREIDERTQLVCLSHATFETGSLLELGPIVERAHSVGALVALDAYQSTGVVPIDVATNNVDFLLGGAHKWLCGSYESAFLYVRPGLLPQLHPAATGWIASADPLSFGPPAGWADSARRFAGGTPAVLPSLFSRPGLALIRETTVEVIRFRSLAHTDRIIARADDAKLGVATPRPYDQRGGIVTLRFPGAEAVARALIASGFVCSYRNGLRVAPHFYNTEDEVERFMDELVRRAREVA